jgi:AcrR family transcriptional regulator
MSRLPIAKRRHEIVDAAVRVALRDGIDRLTTRNVASEAGVAVSVLHYCFGTRDALLRELITRIVDDTSKSLAPVFEGDGDLRTRINRAIEAFCSAIEIDPARHLLTYEIAAWTQRNPEFAGLGEWQYQCYYRATEAFLLHLAEVTGVTWTIPVETMTRIMVAQNEGVTLAWLIDRDGARARTTYVVFAEMLVSFALSVESGVS